MPALRRKPVLKRIKQRKRQIIIQRYKQAGFLTIFIFLILVIGGVIMISIYSRSAKPGDLLYPWEINLEQMQLSFTTINPEEMIPVLISQSEKRILEASQLAPDPANDSYLRDALSSYKSTLNSVIYQMNEARARTRDIHDIEPQFINSLLDNLQSLSRMYDNSHLEQQKAINDAVVVTANAYDQEVKTLEDRRKDLNIAAYKERFYEIQQELRGKGVVIY